MPVTKEKDVTTNITDDAFSYVGIFGEGTELRYIPLLSGVKEEIILDKYTGQNVFEFKVKTNGCYLTLAEDGGINIVSDEDDEVVQKMDAPFAYDSKGSESSKDAHYTEDCSYKITEVSKTEYKLTLTVSKDWLTADTTEYPVTIDPVTSNISNMKDAPIYADYPFSGGAADKTNDVGYMSGYKTARSLIYFELPSAITSGAVINEAKYWTYKSGGGSTSKVIALHLITSDWTEDVEWDNAPSFESSSFTTKTVGGRTTADSGSNWFAFDVKSAVERWISGTPNYGFLMKYQTEPTSSNNKNFVNRESTLTSYLPYTVINYSLDEAAPTYTSVTGASSDWQNTPVTLTVNGAADDTALDVLPYSFSTVQGQYNWQASNISPQYTSRQTVYVYIRDSAGNITSCGNYDVKVDTEAPTITSVSGNDANTGAESVTLTIQGASDGNGVGLNSSPYSFSSQQNTYNWQASNSKTFTTNQTVYIYLRDALGNIALRDTVEIDLIDSTAPTITGITVTDSGENKVITVTATDSQSDTLFYSYDGGDSWVSNNTYTVSQDNYSSVVVKVKDSANNIASCAAAAPTNFKTDAVSDSAVQLSWDAPNSSVPAVLYEIYCEGILIGTTENTSTLINNLEAYNNYTFYVKAKNLCGETSAQTESIEVIAKLATPQAQIVSSTSTQVNLSWNSAFGAEYYEIKCGNEIISNVTGTSSTITGLIADSEYPIQVRAVSQNSQSLWSDTMTALTMDGTYVSSAITTNTTWTTASHPYIVSGDLEIEVGATLTIEPGTIVLFQSTEGAVAVYGTLDVNGTANNNVVFAPAGDYRYGKGTNTAWQGVLALENSNVNLEYAHITGSDTGSIIGGGVFSATSSLIVRNSLIENSYNGIQVAPQETVNSNIVIENNTIKDIYYTGIWYVMSDAETDKTTDVDIRNNTIDNTAIGVSVTFFGNTFEMSGNTITNSLMSDFMLEQMRSKGTTDEKVDGFTGFETNTFTGPVYVYDDSAFVSSNTWPKANYYFNFNLTYATFGGIPEDVIVNFAPGSNIYLMNTAAIGVAGTLNLNGTEEEPITVRSDAYIEHPFSNESDSLYWSGFVVFNDGTFNANYTHISDVIYPDTSENTGTEVKALTAIQTEYNAQNPTRTSCSVTLANSKIDNCYAGVISEYTDNAKISLVNNDISAKYQGVLIDDATSTATTSDDGAILQISGNKITAEEMKGISISDVDIPTITLSGNNIYECGEYCIAMAISSTTSTIVGFDTNSWDGKLAFSGYLPTMTLAAGEYDFAGVINIPAGRTVNIDAGAKINCLDAQTKVIDGVQTTIPAAQIQVDGTLLANGVQGKEVRFVSNKAEADWNAIIVDSTGSFVAHYTRIQGSGDSNTINTAGNLELYNCRIFGDGIGVYAYNQAGKLIIQNSKIACTDADGRPLSLYVQNADSISITGNTFIAGKDAEYAVRFHNVPSTSFAFSNNNVMGAKDYSLYLNLTDFNASMLSGFETNTFENKVYLGTYTRINVDMTWPKANYHVRGLSVAEGKTLTLMPGTMIQFSDVSVNKPAYFHVHGTLNANGTEDEPIILTSMSDPLYSSAETPAYWGYLFVNTNGTLNARYLTIKYSGASSTEDETTHQLEPNFSLQVKGTTNVEYLTFMKIYGSAIYLYENSNAPSFDYTSFIDLGMKDANNASAENAHAIYTKDTDDVSALLCYWDSPNGRPQVYELSSTGEGEWVNDGARIQSERINDGADIIWTYDDGKGGTTTPYSSSPYTLADLRRSVPNGSFVREYTDLSMTNSAGNFDITRIYNSMASKIDSLFGYGWSLLSYGYIKDYSIEIVDDKGNFVTVPIDNKKTMVLPDGNTYTITKDDNGNYSCSDGRFTVAYDATTTRFTITSKDGTVYYFNESGKLASYVERSGYTKSFTYSSGLPTRISDSSGRKYTLTFENGHIKTVTDELANTITYGYSTDGLLTTVTDAMGYTTTYGYDDNDNLISVTDPNGDVLESATYYDTGMDNHGRVNSVTDIKGKTTYYSYNGYANMVTMYNDLGQYTFVTYDDNGYVTKTEYPDESVEITTYDTANEFGEASAITDKLGMTTSSERDANGNITKTIYPDESTVENTYDQYNNLVKTKDVNDVYTFYIYDSTGKYLLKTATALSGQTEYSETNGNYSVTTNTYYSIDTYGIPGLIHTVTDPAGRTTTYTYDSYGNVATTTDAKGDVARFTYDKNGRLLTSTSPAGYVVTNTYDKNGNLTKTVNHGGETTQYVYDNNGNKVEEINPRGNKTTYTYHPSNLVATETDALGNVTSYTYDTAGNVQTKTMPDGSVYRYVYDEMNRVTEEYLTDVTIGREMPVAKYIYTIFEEYRTVETRIYTSSSKYESTIRFYDYKDRNYKTINPDGSEINTVYNSDGTIAEFTNENGLKIYYQYDLLKNVTAQWSSKTEDTYMYVGYTYDGAGNILTETTGITPVAKDEVPTNVYVQTNTYDNVGNILTETHSDGSKTEYTYNNEGHVASVKEYKNATEYNLTTYEYNHLGEVTKSIQHVSSGDIAGNEFASTETVALTTTYEYDANGNVTKETSPLGRVTTYTYNANDQLLTTSVNGIDENGDAATITVSQTYNSLGNISTSTDAEGNTTQYFYDAKGNLTKEVDALGNTTWNIYDLVGNQTVYVSPNNYVADTADDALPRTEYDYDSMGRVTAVSQTYFDNITSVWKTYTESTCSYNPGGSIATETDALGNTTRYTYNLAGDKTKTTDALGNVTTYSYDALSRTLSETFPNGLVVTYEYDQRGNVTKTTRTSGDESIVTSATYDFLGNLLTETDARGNTTTYTYNAFGQLRSVTTAGDDSIAALTTYYQYDRDGRLVKEWNTAEKLVTYVYDTNGNLLSKTESDLSGENAITVSNAYDLNGNVRFATDGNGNVTTNTYDAQGRLLTSTLSGKTTTYGYDKNGNLVSQTDAFGNTSTKEYDALNREVRIKDANGITQETKKYDNNSCQISSTDALGNVTTYSYDALQRITCVTDPLGHTTTSAYDEVGNLISETDALGETTTYTFDDFSRMTAVTLANGETTTYTYDANGNALSQTDAAGRTTSYEYNVANLTTKIIAPDEKTETYFYTSDGLLAGKRLKNSTLISYAYDVHGRMTSKSANAGSDSQTVTYTYDNNGNNLTVSNTGSTITRSFDAFGRVTSKTETGTGQVTYVYDITEGLDSGFTAETATDKDGNVTRKVYDKAGRLYTVTPGSNVTTYTYNDNGSVKDVTYQSGAKESYTYNADNSLASLVNTNSDGSVINQYSYVYDAVGNVISKTDETGTTNYTYDSVDRLVMEVYPSGKTITYQFDGSGNRTFETIVELNDTTVVRYNYTIGGLLENTIKYVNDQLNVETDYYYDDNGNQIETCETRYENGVEQPEVTTLQNVYDNFNQLVISRVSNGDGETETVVCNTYNGEGLRIRKTVDDVAKNFRYEGDKVVAEYDGNFSLTAQNVYGLNLLSRVESNARYYYMYNGHADVTSLINATTNAVAATYYYDSYGTLTTQTGNVANSYLYAGYQYDAETGLYYLNARMYDSKTARFIQEDTYRGNKTDPLSLNLYTYCANNPLKYEDPTGHNFIKSALSKGAKAVKKVAKKAVKAVKKVAKAAKTVVKKVVSAVKYVVKTVVKYVTKAVKYVANKVQQFWNSPGETVQSVISDAQRALEEKQRALEAKIQAYQQSDTMKFALTATAVDNSMDASEKGGILDMLGDFVDAKLNDLSGLKDDAWDFVKNNKKDLLHTALDVVGMMPGVGNVADILNAALYASEGDLFNAVMSLSSSVPVLGNLSTTAKYTTKTLDTSLSFLKNTGKVDGLLDGKKLLKDSDGLLTKLFKKADEVPVENVSDEVSTIDRIRNVAQRNFDYAVENPRKEGLNRMQLGKDAEIQATRWTRKWAKKNGVDLSENGLHFQVRGEHSVPDMIYEPTKTIMDFKLTPKAVRKTQSDNFKKDFPGYTVEYIFGPGPWRN